MSKEPAGEVLTTDVCIVGSGPAGLAVAKGLAGSPLRVLVVEAGGRGATRTSEAPSDVITVGRPLRTDILDRQWRFGGSSLAWFGRIAAPDPVEFIDRPWLGMPGWPISYQEMQPWLRRSAEFLSVRHPEMLSGSEWSGDATWRLVSSHGSTTAGVFLWAEHKDLAKTALPWLRSAGNIRVLLRATVTALVPEESTARIGQVRVRLRSGASASIASKWVVLAAGGFENPRLLLASNDLWPAGVGNQCGAVGRFFMEHPRVEGAAVVDLSRLTARQIVSLRLLGERIPTRAGKAQLRIKFSPRLQQEEELLNHSLHGYFCFRGDDGPGVEALRRVRQKLWRKESRGLREDAGRAVLHSAALGRLAFEKFVTRKPNRLVLVDQMEQGPASGSRVFVDWDRRDDSGLPAVVLDWKVEEAVFRSQKRMHALTNEFLSRAGIHGFSSALLSDPSYTPPVIDMKHPMGTTRMSRTERDGVVNAQCQVHGVQNLFIAGSSVLPVSGHANPTLTISALGLRLGEHLRSMA